MGSENPDPLPKLESVEGVRDTVARLIADVYAGKVHSKVAAGLAPLLNLQLRAIETTDLENRLIRVEKLLAKAEEDSGPKRVRFPRRREQRSGFGEGESMFSDPFPKSHEGT